ncbi:Hypothetical protein NCS54_00245400 [Fusarium falciforme]|uniref:Hypothetical protein n=1 Tax=Fusarium falciforme TaxID=195108 RepID=UPI0023002C35|nr:Hypothetical protein NCS54_00245400 [Fusarium falciforme]WAO85217.1 Hypothetical protein NCS54_00245400 [Fusarium falciforme]
MSEPCISHRPLRSRFYGIPRKLTHYTADHLSRDNCDYQHRLDRRIEEYTRHGLATSHFDGVAWRDDGLRLHELSKIPSSASHIRSVKFNLTRVDQDMFQNALADIKDPQKRAESNLLYRSSQGEATEPVAFPRKLVAAALRDLPNLESVTFTWVECPWKKHIAADGPSFEEESLARAGKEVFKTQQAIIEALRERNLPLKSLTLEPFMPQCVLALSSFDPAVSTVFGSITRLTLKLDYGVSVFKPNYLNYFISLMPNIHHLSIHAWSAKDEASGIDFCTKTRLRHLESIDFSCLKIKYGTLAKFFSDHGSTIKRVNLDNLFLWCEPAGKWNLGWDDMLLDMRDSLTALQRISLSGTFTNDAGQNQVFLKRNGSGVRARELRHFSSRDEFAPLESCMLANLESVAYPRQHDRNAKKRTRELLTPSPDRY